MTWMSLGSLALPHHLNRHSVALRQDLARHTREIASGEAASIPRHRKGDLTALLLLDHRASRLEAARQATRHALTEAEVAQSALEGLATLSSAESARQLAVSTAGADDASLRQAAQAARQALDTAVGTLSASVAGRALFSGVVTDRAPLPSAESVLSALAPLVAGATSADALAAALDTALNAPGGVFETALYQGGAAASGAPIDRGDRAADLPVASDPAFRRLLGGLAMAIFAGDDTLGLPAGERQALARAAALELSAGAAAITATQARLGAGEAGLAALSDRIEGETAALALTREALVGVDPYEAAGRLQTVETRLELLYALTARTARLSLAEYLR